VTSFIRDAGDLIVGCAGPKTTDERQRARICDEPGLRPCPVLNGYHCDRSAMVGQLDEAATMPRSAGSTHSVQKAIEAPGANHRKVATTFWQRQVQRIRDIPVAGAVEFSDPSIVGTARTPSPHGCPPSNRPFRSRVLSDGCRGVLADGAGRAKHSG
jgi:hypothetical protein